VAGSAGGCINRRLQGKSVMREEKELYLSIEESFYLLSVDKTEEKR
jgi:hypothetical protein